MTETSYSIQGQEDPTVAGSLFNAVSFVVNQIMGGMATATLAKVTACSNDGSVAPQGTVNVQPLINQVDGAGNATPHGTIYNVPYMRLQSGDMAVIIDPQVGDLGLVVFASTDISSVQATNAQANPGSRRRFDWADGIYVATILSATTPTQYLQINSDGIALKSGAKITLTDGQGKVVTLNNDGTGTLTGNWTVSGNLNVTGTSDLQGSVTGGSTANFSGDVVANGTSVHGHDHHVIGVQTGSTTLTTTAPL